MYSVVFVRYCAQGSHWQQAAFRIWRGYSERYKLIKVILLLLTIILGASGSRSFLVATWYRPPDSPVSIFNEFEELVNNSGPRIEPWGTPAEMASGLEVTPWNSTTWVRVRQVVRKPAMLCIHNPQIGKLAQNYRMINGVESFAKANKHSTS